MDQYKQLIDAVIWVASIGTLVVVGSFLLSFLERPIRATLGRIRSACSRAGRAWVTRVKSTWATYLGYWKIRQREFTHPIVVELSRLRRASASFGRPAFEGLSGKVERLRDSLEVLERLRESEVGDRDLVLKPGGDGILWVVFTIALGALAAMSAANFWLLRLFFQQVTNEALAFDGVFRLMTTADVVAALFPLAEISAGVMLHVLQREPGKTGTPAESFLGSFAPWAILASLGIVEVFAYAELSLKFGLENQFALDLSNPVYYVAKYFMAAFGAALTLGIAGLSYYVIEAYEKSAGPRRLARTRRNLDSARSALAALKSTSERTVAETVEALDEAERVIAQRLELLDGAGETAPAKSLANQIAQYAGELLSPSENAVQRPNAAGLFCKHLVLAVTWILLLWLNAGHFERAAGPFDATAVRILLGFSLAGLVVGLGYNLSLQDYARRDSQQSVIEGHGIPSWLLFMGCAATIALSISLSVLHEPISRSIFPNVIHGIALPTGLMFASVRLPELLQALVMAAALISALGLMAIQSVAAVVAIAGEVLSWLMMAILNLAAAPGRAVRELTRKR